MQKRVVCASLAVTQYTQALLHLMKLSATDPRSRPSQGGKTLATL